MPRLCVCRNRWDDDHVGVARQRSKVVDDAPDLGIRQPAFPSGHHRRRHAFFDNGEDLTVSRTVIPLIVGQIWRLLSTLLSNDRDRDTRLRGALADVAVTGLAIRVIRSFSDAKRLRGG